jgi:hypothetical protein
VPFQLDQMLFMPVAADAAAVTRRAAAEEALATASDLAAQPALAAAGTDGGRSTFGSQLVSRLSRTRSMRALADVIAIPMWPGSPIPASVDQISRWRHIFYRMLSEPESLVSTWIGGCGSFEEGGRG